MENSLLVAARDEYTSQLQNILSDTVYSGIKSIWNKSKHEKNKNALRVFQDNLCSVPQWNQEIIVSYYKKATASAQVSEEYLDKVIEAVFLSNVKILSVIKINGKKQTISVPIPDTKNFIHRVFIETARQFYTDPYLIDDREYGSNTLSEIQRNVKRSFKVISESIDKTIRTMIPMEEILNKYLQAQEEEDEVVKSSSSEEESVHDDGDDHEQESLEEDDSNTNEQETPSYVPPVNQPETQQGIFQPAQPSQDPFMEQPGQQPGSATEAPQGLFEQQPQPQPEQQPQPLNQPQMRIDLREDEKFFSDSD